MRISLFFCGFLWKGSKMYREHLNMSEPTKDKNNNNIHTKHSLFMSQAPNWNFELGENEILKRALKSGFVVKIGKDRYLENPEYGQE